MDDFPIVATYRAKSNANTSTLNDDEYSEDSDSEDLTTDALPPRWINRWYGSCHSSDKLNFFGNAKLRSTIQYEKYQMNSRNYDLYLINALIERGKYREADRRLTVLLEANEKPIYHIMAHVGFNNLVIRPILTAYDNAKIQKPTEEDLEKYTAHDWIGKLKVLTGIQIPQLTRQYKWN